MCGKDFILLTTFGEVSYCLTLKLEYSVITRSIVADALALTCQWSYKQLATPVYTLLSIFL